MAGTRAPLDEKVDSLFCGRESQLSSFRELLTHSQGPHKVQNIYGVTGAGKSFLLHRWLKLAKLKGLPTAKIQLDGKDTEESISLGQPQEILRHIAVRLRASTPRFSTAYLTWSMTMEIGKSEMTKGGSSVARDAIEACGTSVLEFLVNASLNPGGLLLTATKLGWRFLAEKVNEEPLAAFHKSAKGKEFCQELKAVPAEQLPSMMDDFLSKDLQESLPMREDGGSRAVVAFDSWEQFVEQFPERRSRWRHEKQLIDFMVACRPFVQFVIVGQNPVAWDLEDPLIDLKDIVTFCSLKGLSREASRSYFMEQRGFTSAPWVEEMLDVTVEDGSGSETRHHALSLGLIADTAKSIIALDPRANPATLKVKPNDLEDIVRRFMTVREDLEPAIERLALTPHFDDKAVAAALGKAYDEFNAMSDFEMVQKCSFISNASDDKLTMHGLMRRLVRDRLARNRPDKLVAAHRSWKRHFEGREMPGEAFRHWLAFDPEAAIDQWQKDLSQAWKASDAGAHSELVEWGHCAESEREFLNQESAARFSLVWASALRQVQQGDKVWQLNQALSSLARVQAEQVSAQLWKERQSEFARVLAALADLLGGEERFQEADSAFAKAFDLLELEKDGELWADLLVERACNTNYWGRATASATRMRQAVAEAREARAFCANGSDLWTRAAIILTEALSEYSYFSGEAELLNEAISTGILTLDALDSVRDRLLWTQAQYTLASAYRNLAEFSDGTQQLELAALAIEQCLGILSESGLTHDWAQSHILRAYIYVEWSLRSDSIELPQEAIASCDKVLEVTPREADPLTWSLAHGNMAKALRVLGERLKSPEKFSESAREYEKALEARSRQTKPFLWAIAQMNLAETLRLWCILEPDRARLQRSCECYESSLLYLSEESAPTPYQIVRSGYAEVKQMLKSASA